MTHCQLVLLCSISNDDNSNLANLMPVPLLRRVPACRFCLHYRCALSVSLSADTENPFLLAASFYCPLCVIWQVQGRCTALLSYRLTCKGQRVLCNIVVLQFVGCVRVHGLAKTCTALEACICSACVLLIWSWANLLAFKWHPHVTNHAWAVNTVAMQDCFEKAFQAADKANLGSLPRQSCVAAILPPATDALSLTPQASCCICAAIHAWMLTGLMPGAIW